MRLMKFLVLTLLLCAASTAFADWTEKFDGLVKEGKYLTAANYLHEDKAAFETPEGLRRYVHLLVTYDGAASNFHAFALRDLNPGETLETLKNFPEATKVVETDLEAVVYERYTQAPDDPTVNFAVGEYLSRMYECGCGAPNLFVGEASADMGYFIKAHDAGIFDGWSLFRIGLGYQAGGDLAQAIPFYRRSLKLMPDYLSTSYNLAVALFLTEDVTGAEIVLLPIVDKYKDDSRNSDTHHLLARIAEFYNNPDKAEVEYRLSLKLEPTHENAFADYLEFLKAAKREKEYVGVVRSYLANDWASPGPFNVYIDYLQRTGIDAADYLVFNDLSSTTFAESEKKGSFNYGMGRLALLLGVAEKSLIHYKLALGAFLAMENPPEGAVDAMRSLITEAEAAVLKKPAPPLTPAEEAPKEAK